MSKDFFSNKAKSYDQVNYRVANVDNIASTVLSNVQLRSSMNVLDFGSGTGLLLEKIAPFVKTITAVDISNSMNQQLEQKRARLPCQLEIIAMDLSTGNLNKVFDGIISSMTMHHIEDTKAMFAKFYSMLRVDGFIAIADLDSEDGSFHSENTGVFHTGFDRDELHTMAEAVGFVNVEIIPASIARKPQGDYPVFLLTAIK